MSLPPGLPAGTLLIVRAYTASQAEQAAFVVVISEDEGHQTLLQARVHMEDIYQRQQGARCPAQPPLAHPHPWPSPQPHGAVLSELSAALLPSRPAPPHLAARSPPQCC
jgi:hypothetical protein